MSDNETTGKQPLPLVTRRRLVAVAGGFFLDKASPILPRSPMDAGSPEKDGVGGSFFLTPRFRELMEWISINNAFDEGKHLPDFSHQFSVYGHRLLRNPPSRATVLQFLSSPVFIQSAINADGYVVGKRPIEETANDIIRMSRFTQKDMDRFIEARIKQGPQSVFGLQRRSHKVGHASGERGAGLRVFTGMATARKAAEYPISALNAVPDAGIPVDPHKVSNDWRSHAQQETLTAANKEIGR